MAQMIEAGHASQNSAQPRPERDQAEHGDEEVTEDHRDRQHHEVDQERKIRRVSTPRNSSGCK